MPPLSCNPPTRNLRNDPTNAGEMFENVCTLPLSGALLSQALHPTEPILTVGLYNGRVQSFRLPPSARPSEGGGDAGADGRAMIETLWETRRHKRGCRGLVYTPDGNGEF